jgi:hypothetical protein
MHAAAANITTSDLGHHLIDSLCVFGGNRIPRELCVGDSLREVTHGRGSRSWLRLGIRVGFWVWIRIRFGIRIRVRKWRIHTLPINPISTLHDTSYRFCVLRIREI